MSRPDPQTTMRKDPLRKTPAPTPTQRAAAIFVATMAESIDAAAGIVVPNGTQATRDKVIGLVMDRFFAGDAENAE